MAVMNIYTRGKTDMFAFNFLFFRIGFVTYIFEVRYFVHEEMAKSLTLSVALFSFYTQKQNETKNVQLY